MAMFKESRMVLPPLEREKPKHIHKYQRVKLGSKGYTVYKCMQPNCAHFIRVELVIGMLTECWRCGSPFTMNQWSATYKKPHCRECTREHGSKRKERELEVAAGEVQAQQEQQASQIDTDKIEPEGDDYI